MKKVFLIVLLFFVVSCSNEKIAEKTFYAMNTPITIRVYNKSDVKHLEEAEKMFNYYNELFDRYHAYDTVNLYTINKNSETEISGDLLELLAFANKMKVESDYLLDVNIGSLIDTWKSNLEESKIPTLGELNSSFYKKGFEISDGKIIRYDSIIDVGAIGKGYAIEKIVSYFEENNVKEYLINAGGQVHVGVKGSSKFKIGVRNPEDDSNFTVLNLKNIGVSTSGGYERKYTVDGKTYNHIINPKTLYPATFMQSVSVVSKSPLLADALTTILFLMPVEDGIEFIKNYDAEAVFYTNDSKIIRTEGFSKYEQE